MLRSALSLHGLHPRHVNRNLVASYKRRALDRGLALQSDRVSSFGLRRDPQLHLHLDRLAADASLFLLRFHSKSPLATTHQHRPDRDIMSKYGEGKDLPNLEMLKSHCFATIPKPEGNLTGRTALVSGATSG